MKDINKYLAIKVDPYKGGQLRGVSHHDTLLDAVLTYIYGEFKTGTADPKEEVTKIVREAITDIMVLYAGNNGLLAIYEADNLDYISDEKVLEAITDDEIYQAYLNGEIQW